MLFFDEEIENLFINFTHTYVMQKNNLLLKFNSVDL